MTRWNEPRRARNEGKERNKRKITKRGKGNKEVGYLAELDNFSDE